LQNLLSARRGGLFLANHLRGITMRRTLWIAACLCSLALGSPAQAQDWAQAMFRELSHDFGTVAAYSKSEYRFLVTNKYKEPMNLIDVRSSCGCTTPAITKRTINTGESSEIVATFNTHSFRGQRSAVLTVSFGEPFSAQVQLRISGFIRGDVVMDPAAVNFGRVRQGSPAERTIDVSYAGRSDWKITDVRAANEYLTATLSEKSRRGGLVDYRLTVRLKEGAPAGYLHDQLSLVTNDASGNQIPLDVEGKVEADLTVSPSPLVIGAVSAGEQVSKKVVVRGTRPFKLTAVNCPPGFSVELPKEAKNFHVLEVKLQSDKAGDLSGKIRIETDMGPAIAAEIAVHAAVVAKQP
jgi:hypothetical protein